MDVHFDDHPNDIAMRNHAFGQGKAMYEAVGATRPSQRRPILQRTTSALTG